MNKPREQYAKNIMPTDTESQVLQGCSYCFIHWQFAKGIIEDTTLDSFRYSKIVNIFFIIWIISQIFTMTTKSCYVVALFSFFLFLPLLLSFPPSPPPLFLLLITRIPDWPPTQTPSCLWLGLQVCAPPPASPILKMDFSCFQFVTRCYK